MNRKEQATNHKPFFDALMSSKMVSGYTHTYYRYPARFSPEFAREAIERFSEPGDVVLDPFMGGGTTAVESIAAGRKFLGSDINELAHFASRVKTSLLNSKDEAEVLAWASTVLPANIHLSSSVPPEPQWAQYQKHVPWRIRTLLSQALGSLNYLKTQRQQEFARCSLLSAAQWALDCKSEIPSKESILEIHQQIVGNMIGGNNEFAERFKSATGRTRINNQVRRLLRADAARLHDLVKVREFGRPKLILTSPPYMGVHVLYHRWQILGRRETSVPYWIVNKPDGHAGAFYTFADRRAVSPVLYLSKLRACFRSVHSLMNNNTLIVQLVAFPDADVQLPLYLTALADVGLQHCESVDTNFAKGIVAREVPNRRWYALLANQSSSSKEFLLVHRKAR